MQHLDLTYASCSARNRLDLFLPEGVSQPPLVVYIHGGAFRMGDKAFVDPLDQAIKAAVLGAGLALASINYRFSAEAIWPAQLQDLRDAFAFLRDKAGELGFDGARMASFGPSAGGYYSAMAGIALAEDAATRLRASVCWFPPVDFGTMDADMEATGTVRGTGRNDAPGSPESDLIGACVADNPDLARAASPLSYLDALPPGTALPPFLIMHGALDPLIAPAQAQRLHRALVARGGDSQLVILPEGTHGGGSFERPETMARVLAFLTQHLRVE
jgi:acetyl esterase/lipase